MVYRPGASLGCADLVAMKAGHAPLLVQVKHSANPYMNFRPAEREALRDEARKCGAVPLLAWWAHRASEHKLLDQLDWP